MTYVLKGKTRGRSKYVVSRAGDLVFRYDQKDALRFSSLDEVVTFAGMNGLANTRIVRLVERKAKTAPHSEMRRAHFRAEESPQTQLLVAHAIVQWGYAMALFVERRRSETLFRLYERERDENIRIRRSCPNSTVDAYRRVLSVLCDALDKGGFSSSKIAEQLSCTVGALHGYGLQAVANAITEASELERALEIVGDSGVVVCEEPIDHMLFRIVKERDDARRELAKEREAHGCATQKCDMLAKDRDAADRVVEAARLFRKADTGGGFSDRVVCGNVLDAALANYARRALGLGDSHDADAADVAKKVGMP